MGLFPAEYPPDTQVIEATVEQAMRLCNKLGAKHPPGLIGEYKSSTGCSNVSQADRSAETPSPPSAADADPGPQATSYPEPAPGPIGTSPPTATPCPDGESKSPEAPAELPDLVTLDQAAAAAHTSKRTLERHKTQGTLPEPVREGGGGKHALYDWKVMRPWLTETFGINLPETFPANRK